MFKSYLKIAFRNLRRHIGFSTINIAGLTLGLTACLLIGLFVWDEKQYDKAVPDGENIYRVYLERTTPEGTSNAACTPPMFASTMEQQYPEVEQTMRILMTQFKGLFEVGEKKMYEEDGLFAESTFLDLFKLPLKYGSRTKALDDPTSIVLSAAMAERYFGKTDPVGKKIALNKESFVVKAVLADDLKKFHLKVNFILPFSAAGIPKERMQSWQWQQFFTYVKLKKGSDPIALQNKFRNYVKTTVHPQIKDEGFTYMPRIQPLERIHLYSSNFIYDNAIRGNITYVKALSVIAIFILLIACFNFINLATAKSLQRAKEVGVRKAIGAARKQLMLQFTGETIILTLISIIISTALVFAFLPVLNKFTGKEMTFDIFANPLLIFYLLLGALAVGVLAGFYPALILSGFKPIKVLKSSVSSEANANSSQWLRKSLVVVQFALSALLIVSAIVVYRQVDYLHNKDLGFNREEIMFFPMRGDNMFAHYDAFKNELQKSPGISSVSIGYGFPGDIFAGDDIIVPKNGQNETHPVTQLMVDFDYVKTLGLHMIAGRDFSKEITTDKYEGFIINETAVRELGFGTPQKALGEKLMWRVWVSKMPDSMKVGRVIGVVKDFNYKSLYDKMESTVLQIYPPAYWKVAVKMQTADLNKEVAFVKNVWSKFTPDYPIEYKFMDENFEAMYKSEEKLMALLWIFTGIAIFVGCLGLFGLAAYAAERRTKEIGIRKVLGASVNGIVLLLSKDFLKLVVIALVIASPIAWYFMNKWLQDFAFRINISWWMFGLAAVIALAIALVTVSFQAIRAAIMNPVKSLRTE